MRFIIMVLGRSSAEFTARVYAKFAPEAATSAVREYLENDKHKLRLVSGEGIEE